MAADLPVKAPIVAPVVLYNWTGCYIGIEGGYKFGKSQHYFTDPFNGVTWDVTDRFNIDGGLAGGTLGCNYQWPSTRWVLGFEGDWSWTGVKGSANDLAPFFNPAFVSTTKEKWIATLRARFGAAVGPTGNVLLYVTGGLAGTDAEIDVTSPTGVTASESKTVWGWTAGAGIEWAFLPHWTAKLEYLYLDFGSPEFFCPGPVVGGITFSNRCSGVDITQSIVRVGLNYKF